MTSCTFESARNNDVDLKEDLEEFSEGFKQRSIIMHLQLFIEFGKLVISNLQINLLILVFLELNEDKRVGCIPLSHTLFEGKHKDHMDIIRFGQEESLLDVFRLYFIVESAAMEFDELFVNIDCVFAPWYLERNIVYGDYTVTTYILDVGFGDDELVQFDHVFIVL